MRRAMKGMMVTALFLLVAGQAWADGQGPGTLAVDARSEARVLAEGQTSALEALAATPPDAETIPGYEGTSVRQSGYTDHNLANQNILPRDQSIRDAEEAMTNLPSPVTLDPGKFGTAMDVMRNPRGVFDLDRYLSGQYAGCSYKDSINKVPVEVTCDRWLTSERKHCPLDREVRVRADVHYSCERWKPDPEFTCTRTSRVSCRKNSDCPAYKSVQGRLVGTTDTFKAKQVSEFEWEVTDVPSGNPPIIRTLDNDGNGTYGPAVRGSWNASTYRGSWWVPGSAVQRLKRFVITGGSYKACLDISVNGKDIFNGQWRPADRDGYFLCDYPGGWHNIPRIDLLPHLKGPGWNNNIYFFFKNYGGGSFHLNYEILVGCCDSSWRTTCTE